METYSGAEGNAEHVETEADEGQHVAMISSKTFGKHIADAGDNGLDKKQLMEINNTLTKAYLSR